MCTRSILLAGVLLLAFQHRLSAQKPDTVFLLSGIIYDDLFHPVPASHVINLNTHAGDVTDSLGIFRIPVHSSDTILVRNIAFQDTLVPVWQIIEVKYIRIKRKFYPLQEVRVFKWGSTYNDFMEAVIAMPNQQTLGESMGLQKQDPDYIPFDMNEGALKSTAFLITSPVSYLYYNLSRREKSARKVFWLNKNREKYERFDAIISLENIAYITELSGIELQKFMAFLYERMVCDFKCSELQIYSEVHSLWDVYQELQQE